MKDSRNMADKSSRDVIHRDQRKKSAKQLNFDVQSYRFHDLDLAMAIKNLPPRDQGILILHLMGHTQDDIGGQFSISRSMVSKRLSAIVLDLKSQLKAKFA